MRPENRVTLFCLVLWLGFALLAVLLRDGPAVEFRKLGEESPVEWPMRLDTGDVLVGRFHSGASTQLLALDLKGVTSSDLLIRIGVNGAWPACSPEPRLCRLFVTVPGEATVYMTARNSLTIDGAETTTVRHQWSTVAGTSLPVLLAGIFLMIPLSWLLMSRPLLQRRVLLGLTLALLLYLQPVFTVIVVVLLGGLHRIGTRSPPGLRVQLVIALGGAALILLAAKYAISGLERVFANPGGFDLLMPLGISYVVIRVADTQIRWYRNQLRDVPLDEFLFFVFFPAALSAGPVDTLERFRSARFSVLSAGQCASGLRRAAWGVFKKLVIADALLLPLLWTEEGYGLAVLSPGSADPVHAVCFLFIAFAYVYVDFSAYSDIAIGLSRLLGWSAPENFNFPFLARTLMDYWRRWHMSVSGWCMRNIYMPLLLSTKRPAVASLMVMLGVGMWHSIGFSWMLWALHHGLLIALESEFSRRRRKTRGPAAATAMQRSSRFQAILSVPARAGTLIWVAAGHAFAQIHDPEVALAVYLQFWAGLAALPAEILP